MGSILRKRFDKLARTEHGTLRFIEENMEDHIDAYWGSRKRWEALPEKLSQMEKGDWRTPLEFRCAFGHTFKASPRLVLEGGHWCDECERKSWNYGQRAKRDPFFAQVWNPLHDDDELRECPKEVTELDV